MMNWLVWLTVVLLAVLTVALTQGMGLNPVVVIAIVSGIVLAAAALSILLCLFVVDARQRLALLKLLIATLRGATQKGSPK